MSQKPEAKISEIRASEPATPMAAQNQPDVQARLTEIESIMRELLQARRAKEQRPRSSRLPLVATALASAALLCAAGQAWWAYKRTDETPRELAAIGNPITSSEETLDSRTQLTIPELARRAPSIRSGSIQAWWAGEQARQVQRLEAQAKRQTLAGDPDGAARSVSRADMIRSRIPSLVEFEKPPTR